MLSITRTVNMFWPDEHYGLERSPQRVPWFGICGTFRIRGTSEIPWYNVPCYFKINSTSVYATCYKCTAVFPARSAVVQCTVVHFTVHSTVHYLWDILPPMRSKLALNIVNLIDKYIKILPKIYQQLISYFSFYM